MVDPEMDGKTRNLLRTGQSIDSPLHSQYTWKANERQQPNSANSLDLIGLNDWTLPRGPSAEFQA